MTKILAIDGSYRVGGITDQSVKVMADYLQAAGVAVETVALRDYPIEFCNNCRKCTQQPGSEPGRCILDDGMDALIDKIEGCDGYILAAPTNFGTVTAIYKRFMERLVVYGFWPWGQNAPVFRKAQLPKKKAVIISSCAAPGVMGRWLFNTRKQLKSSAETVGARVVGDLFVGLVAREPHPGLAPKSVERARMIASRLL